jgi:hypothetical protein
MKSDDKKTSVLLIGEFHDDDENDYKNYLGEITHNFKKIILEFGMEKFDSETKRIKDQLMQNAAQHWIKNQDQQIIPADNIRQSLMLNDQNDPNLHISYIDAIVLDKKDLKEFYIDIFKVPLYIFDYCFQGKSEAKSEMIKITKNYADHMAKINGMNSEEMSSYFIEQVELLNRELELIKAYSNNLFNKIKSYYADEKKYYESAISYIDQTIDKFRKDEIKEVPDQFISYILKIVDSMHFGYYLYDIFVIAEIIKTINAGGANVLVLCGEFHTWNLVTFLEAMGFEYYDSQRREKNKDFDFNLVKKMLDKPSTTKGGNYSFFPYLLIVVMLLLILLIHYLFRKRRTYNKEHSELDACYN